MAKDPPDAMPGIFSGGADFGAADASFKAAFELSGRLPAIRLPAEAELAAMARREAVPKGTEEIMFGVMSRLPHPDAARVLTMIGQHHPDKEVATAARRAAHQVRESIP